MRVDETRPIPVAARNKENSRHSSIANEASNLITEQHVPGNEAIYAHAHSKYPREERDGVSEIAVTATAEPPDPSARMYSGCELEQGLTPVPNAASNPKKDALSSPRMGCNSSL